MSKTVLLLIDLQRDFLETNGRLPVPAGDANRVIAVANRMIEHAQKAGWTMIWIKNEFRWRQFLGNISRKFAAMKGSRGSEIDPRINCSTEFMMVVKCCADGFSNARLEAALKDLAPERIVALGLMTDECVQETARGAISRGYRVEVIEDGVASMTEADHQKGLANLRECGAALRRSEELVTIIGLLPPQGAL
jgi:nicotinamidase-related amidase